MIGDDELPLHALLIAHAVTPFLDRYDHLHLVRQHGGMDRVEVVDRDLQIEAATIGPLQRGGSETPAGAVARLQHDRHAGEGQHRKTFLGPRIGDAKAEYLAVDR